jgi:hypothetical protein
MDAEELLSEMFQPGVRLSEGGRMDGWSLGPIHQVPSLKEARDHEKQRAIVNDTASPRPQ